MSHNPDSDTKTAPWKAQGINLPHNLEKLAQAAAGASSGMAQTPETLPAASNGVRHHAARPAPHSHATQTTAACSRMKPQLGREQGRREEQRRFSAAHSAKPPPTNAAARNAPGRIAGRRPTKDEVEIANLV